jgi:hypothetical protein
MTDSIYVNWPGGKLRLKGASELIIDGCRISMRFSQRDFSLDGTSGFVEEYFYEGSRHKHVYIELEDQIAGCPAEKPGTEKSSKFRFEIGFFDVRYTMIGGKLYYLTIEPIYGALYDYAIITPNNVYFSTLSRRKIFQNRRENTLDLYFV